jgi:hypothetical protein
VTKLAGSVAGAGQDPTFVITAAAMPVPSATKIISWTPRPAPSSELGQTGCAHVVIDYHRQINRLRDDLA